MDFFNLPPRTKVARVVPKNAFDDYTNSKQKKLFSDLILRLTWMNKLSSETINLESKEIPELQIFKVELKEKIKVPKILEIVDKAISYHIVFWIEYQNWAYLSTASKHPHPTNDNIAIIDWTFTSDWFRIPENKFQLNLKGTIDSIFKDLCVQLTGKKELKKESLDEILRKEQEIDRLQKEINKLKSAIPRSKQFNKKVELNLNLKNAEKKLRVLLNHTI